MRTITELAEKESRIWMYLGNPALCREFYKQAHEEGFRFGDLPYGQWAVSYVIGVHDDRKMRHLPIFLWQMSFSADISSVPMRVDYGRYIAGEDDYICHESHFTGGVRGTGR